MTQFRFRMKHLEIRGFLFERVVLVCFFCNFKMSFFKIISQVLLGGILIDALIYTAFWIWDCKSFKKSSISKTQIEFKSSKMEGANDIYYHALFFPESKIPCRFYYKSSNGCTRSNCEFSHKAALLEHLIFYLNKANKTLDMCVYLITCPELCAAILKVKNRRVRVRIITEDDNSDQNNIQIGKLRAEGNIVRTSLIITLALKCYIGFKSFQALP